MRLSTDRVPLEMYSEILRRIEDLERWNPLNQSTVTGTVRLSGTGSVEGGQTRVSSAGLWLPFNGASTSVAVLLGNIRGEAASAQGAAEAARARAELALTAAASAQQTANVAADRASRAGTSASNAQTRADQAHSLANSKPTTAYVDSGVSGARSLANSAQSTANDARSRAIAANSLAQSRASVSQVNELYRITQILWSASGIKDPIPPRPPNS